MNRSNKLKIAIPFVILLIVMAVTLNYRSAFEKKNNMPYKTFIQEVDKGNVAEVYVSTKENIKVKMKDGKILYTQNPRTDNFKELLLLKGIDVHEGDGVNPIEAVPLSIVFFSSISLAVYFIVKGRRGNSGAFKLASIDTTPEKNTGIKFCDIAGNEEAKENIKELVDFIKNPEKYTHYNARMPRGVILYGPPGTGKTLMAKALAAEAGVPFYAVNGSDFVQIYVGVGAGRIRDLFKKAREKGKAVIFIDEIDAIGKKRSNRADGGSDERDQTLNALLSEMSGFKENQGIIVLAATNRLDTLDEALLRPGRFDRHIEVGLPDVRARHRILKLYAENKPMASDVNLEKIAHMTVYFSGAKLENLMNEAAIIAARNESSYITMEHLDKAYGIVMAGDEKKDRSYLKDSDRAITAYHEAGHALVSKLVSPENIVRKVTIIPSTKGAGGYTLNIPPDRMYNTKQQLLNRIKVGLGGRAAEEIIFGKDNITTGAFGDIENVTNVLVAMIKNYGMFESTGLLNYTLLANEGLLNPTDIMKLCSDTIQNLYDEVKELLILNKDKLDRITEALLDKETIFDDEIDELFAA